jgi:HepT-like protein
MTESLKHLAMRIRSELPEIEHTLKRATEGVKRAKQTGDDYYLDGVALNLHSFYSGIERILELIAANVDDIRPEGENWHQTLLKQMAEEVTEVRPAVISDSVRVGLDEYRGFRHIVRNIYTYKFDSARIEKLTEKAGPLFARLRAELLAFADFLEATEGEEV